MRSRLEPFFFARPCMESPVYVCELTKRRYRGKLPQAVRNPEDVVAIVGAKLRREQREHFLVLLLNARHEVISKETVSIGSLNASIVHPREVFKPAVLGSAATIVLVHNHPSGDPEPSDEDLAITKRLGEAGELLGIAVLDHVIVAKRGVVSLRARQLL
jgi:DNA repair protein RadC